MPFARFNYNSFWGGILGALIGGLFIYWGLWPGDYIRGVRVSKIVQRIIYLPIGILCVYFALRDIADGLRR